MEKDSNWWSRWSHHLFIVMGGFYVLLGCAALYLYAFSFAPVLEAKQDFKNYQLSNAVAAHTREIAKVLLDPGTDKEPNPARDEIIKFLSRILGINTDLAFLERIRAAVGERQTPLEDLIQQVREERPSDNMKSSTTADASEDSSNVAPVLGSELFLKWLDVTQKEDLRNAWFVETMATMQIPNLSIRAYFLTGLAFGMIFGGFRALLLAHGSRSEKRQVKQLLFPFATPIIAFIVILLLTGFGPIFGQPLDEVTRKFLMVVTVCIAFGPEEFLLSLKRYLLDVLNTIFDGHSFNTESKKQSVTIA